MILGLDEMLPEKPEQPWVPIEIPVPCECCGADVNTGGRCRFLFGARAIGSLPAHRFEATLCKACADRAVALFTRENFKKKLVKLLRARGKPARRKK